MPAATKHHLTLSPQMAETYAFLKREVSGRAPWKLKRGITSRIDKRWPGAGSNRFCALQGKGVITKDGDDFYLIDVGYDVAPRGPTASKLPPTPKPAAASADARRNGDPGKLTRTAPRVASPPIRAAAETPSTNGQVETHFNFFLAHPALLDQARSIIQSLSPAERRDVRRALAQRIEAVDHLLALERDSWLIERRGNRLQLSRPVSHAAVRQPGRKPKARR